MLEALSSCGCEVRVYGLGEQSSTGNLRFLAVDSGRFIEDLATSRALITTAGNQLLGEALYLGKPVLAIPEERNYEQQINGHFLEMTGAGWSVEAGRISEKTVRSFMENIDRFQYRGDLGRLYGNPAARAVIQRYLSDKKPFRPRSAVGVPVQGWLRA